MKKTPIALLISSILMGTSLAAESTTTDSTSSEDVEVLDTINVVDMPFSQKIGTQKITEAQIKRMPTTNGNITELLKSNPNVQFSNTAETSLNAGEISPEEVSFHGEKSYNNNFTIDGVSNNDNINPYVNVNREENPSGTSVYDLPAASSQSFWINTKLLKNVEVFDSNISAKYGDFTGGVINAEIKDPDLSGHHGSISYRTTRGSWAKYHVQDSDQESFNSATQINFQPEFTKNEYSIFLNQPLSDNTGLLFSYTRTDSTIKYLHSYMYNTSTKASYFENQKRLSETYMLKGVHIAENGDLWKATFMYSPHSAKYPKANVMNGAFTNTGGGYSIMFDWEKQFDNIKMKTKFGYKRTGNEIEHDADVYRRYLTSDTYTWQSNASGQAYYGGYGTYNTKKKTYTLKQDYSVTEFDWGNSTHKINFGWQADFSQASYNRETEAWQYYYSTTGVPTTCGEINECVDGEQWATTAQAFAKRNVKVNDSNYALYAEDNIKWGNLSLSLGARADYNQFLKNINLAPRTSISYDLFGDETSQLFGGVNRYYTTSMLAYKLRQSIGVADRWYRSADTNYQWVYRSTYSNTLQQGNKDLKTPYSDELVLGYSQKFLGMEATLKWVHRNAKDQFSRTLENGKYLMTNNGWSKNDTVTISLDKIGEYDWGYAKVDWGISGRITHNRQNSSNYDTTMDTDDYEYAYYNGQLMYASDLPSSDFSSKWQVSLNLNTEFPKIGLTWDQRFSYVGKRNFIQSKSSATFNCSSANYSARCGSLAGEDIDVVTYEDATVGSQFLVDWRFAYKQPTFKNQFFEITLDINNVLDKTAVAKSSGSNTYYKMGRNFWLGASYNW